jgi:5-methylcytosine-specific restriction endonuclease McrBC regulatory subunit McrC|nr:MAG TPA: Rab11 GTPase, Rab11 Family Interacting transport, Rab11a, FIP3, cytokinesis [Caudoviricetes sp.]
MKYDNMSRTELIKLLKRRNETIEILEKREAVLQKQLENYSDSNVLKLIDDLKKQKKVQAEIINELRRGRAELLQLIGDLTVKIQKGGVG